MTIETGYSDNNNSADRKEEGGDEKGKEYEEDKGEDEGKQKRGKDREKKDSNILQEARLNGRPEVIRGHSWERCHYISHGTQLVLFISLAFSLMIQVLPSIDTPTSMDPSTPRSSEELN